MEDIENSKQDLDVELGRTTVELGRKKQYLEREREDIEVHLMSVHHRRIESELGSNPDVDRDNQSGIGHSQARSVVRSVVAASHVDSELRTRNWVRCRFYGAPPSRSLPLRFPIIP